MASDFVRARKGQLCPVCGADHYCGWSADKSVINCTHTSRKPREAVLPAPAGYELWKAAGGEGGGMLYRKLGPDGKPVKGAMSEEELEERARKKAEMTERAIARAEETEREAKTVRHGGPDHPRVRAYLEARGIPLDRLPGGKLPPAVLFHPAAKDTWDKAAGKWLRCPAIVLRALDSEKKGRGVHLTYLDPGGAPRKRDEDPQKRMCGPIAKAPIRLAGDHTRGALCFTEGFENAMCVLAATGLPVWMAGSADHLQQVEINPKLVERGGPIHTVIICGDFNRREKGQRSAAILANVLKQRWPWLKVYVRLPGIRDVPPAFVADGELADGVDGVDWNDAVRLRREDGRLGIDVIAETILSGIDLDANRREAMAGVGAGAGVGADAASPDEPDSGAGTRAAESFGGGGVSNEGDGRGGAGGGGGVGLVLGAPDPNKAPLIPDGALNRARCWLMNRAMVKGAGRFALARWGGKWWMYTGNRYVEVSHEWLSAGMLAWLNQFAKERVMKRGTEREMLNPSDDTAQEVVKALVSDTFVAGKTMPKWLAPVIDRDGMPLWGDAVAMRHIAAKEEDVDKSAGAQICLPAGRLDLNDVIATESVELKHHTPELFNTVALPFDIDVDRLSRMLAGRPEREVLESLCPRWYKFLDHASGGDARWQAQIQLMAGDLISGDRSGQWIFLFVGAPETGKTTLETMLKRIAGKGNYAAIALSALCGEFALAPLLGKPIAIASDAQMKKFSDADSIVEMLKSISGNGDVPVRDLYEKSQTVKLGCRFCIFCNGMPDLRDDSGGLARRLIVLPFLNPIQNADPRMMEEMEEEAGAVLMWAVMGAIKLARMEKRTIQMCDAGRDARDEYERRGAQIKSFVRECMKRAENSYCTPAEIFEGYEKWCEEQKREPMGYSRFFEAIRWHLGSEYRYEQPRTQGGGRQRVVRGWIVTHDSALYGA